MKNAFKIYLTMSILLLCNIGMANDHNTSKLFIINRTEPGGDIVLSATINFNNKNINIDYNPGGENRTAIIKIGLLEREKIKVLSTINLKCEYPSDPKKNYQSTMINIPNIKKGTIVIWVDKITSKSLKITTPLADNYILNALKIIKAEQTRLSFVGAYKGEKELLNEVGRNYEE